MDLKLRKVLQIDKLKYAFASGEIDDQKNTIEYVNYNSIFTHAKKGLQELSDFVKQQKRTDRRAISTD